MQSEPKMASSSETDANGRTPSSAKEVLSASGSGLESATSAASASSVATDLLVQFPVVGIGASAGGLEPLEMLVGRLGQDGMAYIIQQHLSPEHESLLPDILARHTSLTVIAATDGLVIKTNHIYLIPPGFEVGITQGALWLSKTAQEVPIRSIDSLFRMLASEFGAAAIGVVLSGAGSDGALGLCAIKEEGGITFAQDPTTAGQPSMPQSALDAGCVDFCLSPAVIGDELMRLSAHPYVARKRLPPVFDKEVLSRILRRLHRTFSVDFSEYKPPTIVRRILRRMALRKIDKAEDYLKLIETNSEELSALYGDLLIGVTHFFRDLEPFDTLKNIVFPRLFDKRSTDVPIRIWVPGCATGEEVYSIAICLLEYLDSRPPGFRVQIFGTDLDERSLAKARLGHYPQTIEGEVLPGRLQRFFSRTEKGYEVARHVRDLVVFARHNMTSQPPFSRLDLISCRNVLIYMQTPLQRKVLRVFHYALNPWGILLLGISESIGEATDLFSLLDRKLKLYVKKDVSSPAVFDFMTRIAGTSPTKDEERAPVLQRPTVTIQQLADRAVLDKFGPPGVLLNEHLDVIQFRGQTGSFLSPSPGTATLNVLKLVRPELLAELRDALKQVRSSGLPVVSSPLTLGPKRLPVVLEVMRLQASDTGPSSILILFREVPARTGSESGALATECPIVDQTAQTQIEELTRELLVTKEYLQTTIQDLEVANEELQSSNEELQSANEELQSSNEELETSKEELQSINEELSTVNEEMQNRMAQLNTVQDDLNNVLEIASVSFVIIGMDLRIRRFSAAAAKLLNLIPADLGRPIGYLGNAISFPAATSLLEIESLVSESINRIREHTERVRCSDGRIYTMRVVPYRTSEHAIRGALVEFLRFPRPRPADDPPETQDLISKVLSSLPHTLMLLDEQLRITWVNKSFFETFVVGTEILGRPLDEVWPSRASHPELWHALDQAAANGTPFSDLLVPHPFGHKSEVPMRFGARCIMAAQDLPALTLVVMEEFSEKKGSHEA